MFTTDIEYDWIFGNHDRAGLIEFYIIFALHIQKKQTNKKRRLKIESLFLFFFFNLFNHTYIYTYCISINVYF